MPRAITRQAIRGAWLMFLAAGSLLVAAYAFAYLRYRPYDPQDPLMAKFALSGMDVPMHFFGAGLALSMVPLQASGRVRRRWPSLHRIGGWLSAGGILAGGLGGLSLSLHALGGWVTGTGFFLLASLWMAAAAIGIGCAVAGDIAGHRRWMIRCMAMTLSAVTLRVILLIGTGPLQLPFPPVYTFAAWACWLFNLALCESWLRWSPGITAHR